MKFSFRSNLKMVGTKDEILFSFFHSNRYHLIFESVYTHQNRSIDPYKRINSCNKAKNPKNQTIYFPSPLPSPFHQYLSKLSTGFPSFPSFFFLFYTSLYLNLHGYVQRDACGSCACVRIPRNATKKQSHALKLDFLVSFRD